MQSDAKGGMTKMFWGKKSAKEDEKPSRPKGIPGTVQNYLVAEKKMDPDLVKLLTAVERKGTTGATVNIRIFDNSEAIAKKVEVKDYTSLDECPDLILYEGWFDEGAKQVNLEEKTKANWDTPIFTQTEMQQRIEALKEPGNTIFFYTTAGNRHGGPLGMGAAVIELNPDYPGKKQKKYIMYTADVIDMQPVGKGDNVTDSDKPKNIASCVKNTHRKRMYS
jgi:hypothetical protein